jgi:hypothetical protein
MAMKRAHHAIAGSVAAEAGAWLLTMGFLVIAGLITMVPFILL